MRRRGKPATPAALTDHDCIVLVSDGVPQRWPFRDRLVAVNGRIRVSSFALAHAAARAGLGIAIFPEFACAADLRRKKLVPVLDQFVTDVGSVWLVWPAHRAANARIRSF